MIILEDREIENALFANKEQALVPIEITMRDNELEIITFKRTLDIAKAFEKKFSLNPFSTEATIYLHNLLEPIVNSWGYEVDDIYEGHILTYVLNDLDASLIKPSTKKIRSATGYESLIEYELEDIPNDRDECYFVTIENNKIVSACEMNTEGVFIGATEINVYTSPNYRGKGHGASNVSAMCEYLTKKGARVAYTTHKDNKASSALAEKCGFEKIAQTYYYICYKSE